MIRWNTFAVALALFALTACESAPPQYGDQGEIEVRGVQSGIWADGDAGAEANFVLNYDTTAWHEGKSAPFHRMHTELRLAYDPAEGRIRNAKLTSSEPGRAYRHVCLAPSGAVLHVRMATILDDRREDLTVVKLHNDRMSLDACEEVGVGPEEGLVESFDVLFREDGSYRILPDTKAYLAGAELRVERSMNETRDTEYRVTQGYPR